MFNPYIHTDNTPYTFSPDEQASNPTSSYPIDALHQFDGLSHGGRSDFASNGGSVSSYDPSYEDDSLRLIVQHPQSRQDQTRRYREKKEKRKAYVQQELEKFRAKQSRWQECESYTNAWLKAAYWLSLRSQPVSLVSNPVSSSQSTQSKVPRDIAVQTMDGVESTPTEARLLSEVADELSMPHDHLLTAWRPPGFLTAGPDAPPLRPIEGSPKSPALPEQRRKSRKLKTDLDERDDDETKRKLRRRLTHREHKENQATEDRQREADLASYQLREPFMVACERFAKAWKTGTDSIFEDLSTVLTPRILTRAGTSFSITDWPLKPMPSGILVSVAGRPSPRLLSGTWADGEDHSERSPQPDALYDTDYMSLGSINDPDIGGYLAETSNFSEFAAPTEAEIDNFLASL